jgi:hypothetical protein
MSFKTKYYGQHDGSFGPDLALTGDPGTDQINLINAGYLGGRIVTLLESATAGRGEVVKPCDAATALPIGVLLDGPGEFAGTIGPSGSGKTPFVRWGYQGYVDSQAFDAEPTGTYTVGGYLYCGTGAKAGLWTCDKPANGSVGIAPLAVCSQVPTGQYPMLGLVAIS